jgi:hypothetical protein
VLHLSPSFPDVLNDDDDDDGNKDDVDEENNDKHGVLLSP